MFDAIEKYLPVDNNWSDLEAGLAEIDPEAVCNDLIGFMPSRGADDWSDSGHHDFQYEVGRLLGRLSDRLRALLSEWVKKLDVAKACAPTQRLKNIDADAVFLTFNYTTTPEDVYEVADANVLHIHGVAGNSELVLGHGRAAEDRGSLNDQPGVEKFDSRIIQANELIDDYFSKTYKPTDSLIDEHAAFFRRLCEVERVYVLGHSLSPIDRPYFSALLVVPGLKTANWYAAVRKDSDPTKTVETLVEFGVHKDKACTILWTEA